MSVTVNLGTILDGSSLSKKQPLRYNVPVRKGFLVQLCNVRGSGKYQQSIRFIHSCFNENGQLIALCDVAGNIFIADLVHDKVWILSNITACTVLKFSSLNNSDLIIGTNDGEVYVLDLASGEMIVQFSGHLYAILEITISSEFMCLTTTRLEAILWDLKTNTKNQVLNLEPKCNLKHVLFMPVTDNILACFEDNSALIWKTETFEVIKEIKVKSKYVNFFKSIAFTRNGRAMVFTGYSSQLIVYNLDTWSYENTICLPPGSITSIKKLEFISQPFDGGCNRILVILGGNGKLHFYDMELNSIISCIKTTQEIIKFDCSGTGDNVVCVLRSGEVNVYKTGYFISTDTANSKMPTPPPSTITLSSPRSTRMSIMTSAASFSSFKSNPERIGVVKQQIEDILDVDKLRLILKQFGQYPEAYRLKIWSQLLQLPNNVQQYNCFVDHRTQPSFQNLEKEYPLENKVVLKNLKKVLSNLVTCCPHFSQVSYLPVMIFPFVKVFQNRPVTCFEAVYTIIINWCQFWFEYFPLPPLNILAMAENILHEHDEELLQHLTKNSVTSKLYAWSLLESALSEVLPTKSWCTLWDHVLSNQPAFLIMCVVAFSISNRKTLLAITSDEEFNNFYHGHYPFNVKRLLDKAYWLLNNTREENHPSRYLDDFGGLEAAQSYCTFKGFPDHMIDLKLEELNDIKREQDFVQEEESKLLSEIEQEENYEDVIRRQEVEEARLKKLEAVCKERIMVETARVKEQRKRLLALRRELQRNELHLLNQSRQKIIERNSKQRRWALENIMSNMEKDREVEELNVLKAESNLVKHYSELLHQKMYLEKMMNSKDVISKSNSEYELLKNAQEKFKQELQEIHEGDLFKNCSKQINITKGLAALDSLILRVEMELEKHSKKRGDAESEGETHLKMINLKKESEELMHNTASLLDMIRKENILSQIRNQESSSIFQEGKFRKMRLGVKSSPLVEVNESDELAVINY